MADNVEFKHPLFEDNLPDWQLIDSVISGERRFKKKAFAAKYLLKLNSQDQSADNIALNNDYLERAMLMPFVQQTLIGMLGFAFSKPPKLDLQPRNEYLLQDADGKGTGLVQLAKSLTRRVLAKGGCGIMVDMNANTDGSAAFVPQPFMAVYRAENIINWRYGQNGYSLVVLSETYQEYGQFEEETKPQWRVLRLDNTEMGLIYKVEVYRKNTEKGTYYIESESYPTNASGQYFEYIPFVRCGAQNNTADPDQPPSLELCNLSVKHFRNSADYEWSVFWAGQPQAYMAGLNQTWIDQVLKLGQEEGFRLGSSEILPLPEGGEFGYAQAQPNPLPFDAMKHKEELIVKAGAKLVEKGGATTRIEAGQNANTEHSILSLVVSNVEDAINLCLEWIAEFVGNPTASMVEFNTEFAERQLSAQEITALVSSWTQGALPIRELIRNMQKYGIIDTEKTIDEIIDELDGESTGLNL